MNFDLSEEQRLLESSLDRFLAERCPVARVRELFDSGEGLDETLWRGLSELGVMGLHLPEEYGGSGLELLDLAVVAEAFGRHATPGPFLEHVLGGLAIALGGSEEQRSRWLPGLASGELRVSLALAEGEDRWQPEQWQLPGGARVSGVKEHVPHASGADLFVVGLHGGTLGLVEGSDPGLRGEPLEILDRSRPLSRLHLDGAGCDLLPRGAEAAPRMRDAGLVLLAADACGGGIACLDLAVAYAGTREQFGVKIGSFQALKHQLADMAIHIHPARGLFWFAAHAFEHVPEESAVSAALAKAHLTDRFLDVARASVEAHGGIGYTWECDVQFWLKRAVFDRAFLGDPSCHRRRVAEQMDWSE
ncbi:acyl-CoA/acyl-ACP dehydrogenase [Myxococcota bacterium]|nr:acyl-CoA/acyl-ACP dehydrogenase [Myxococcota bacterium]